MAVDLLRIDDRLVHGQVVEGWLRSLSVTHVVVASDGVVADETQKALYSLAVPYGVELNCLSVSDAAHAWSKGLWDGDHVLVLVSSPDDAYRLLSAGAPVKSVNVGGLHFREGRVQVLKAVSLNLTDIEALRKLKANGVILEARPLPLDEPIELTAHLDRWEQELSRGEQAR
jgi:mannose/fructose/N-acetylgalactosamine-specific phosphotransferase system component IIB